jgi:hypothetical protein
VKSENGRKTARGGGSLGALENGAGREVVRGPEAGIGKTGRGDRNLGTAIHVTNT